MSDAPDWDLLAEDPEAFFELERGYDRKALKRAYNVWIKRYKPDKYPTEFQLIREAYEALLEILKADGDGMSRRPKFTVPIPKVTILEADQKQDQEEDEDREAKLNLDDLDDPEQLYQQLKEMPVSSSRNVYLLAMLSDLVANPDRGFVDYVIEGLRLWPHDAPLLEMLGEWCEEPADEVTLRRVLPEIASAVPPVRFYTITRGLWYQAAEVLSFEDWQQLLFTCERGFYIAAGNSRISFMIALYPALFWKASPIWRRETLASFLEQGQFHSDEEDAELDFFEALLEYSEALAKTEKASPLHALCQPLIQTLCVANLAPCERALEAFNRKTRASPELWLEADGQDESLAALANLLESLIQRLGLEPHQYTSIPAFVQTIRSIEDRFAGNTPWLLYNLWYNIANLAAMLGPVFLLASVKTGLITGLTTPILAFYWIIYYRRVMQQPLFEKLVIERCQNEGGTFYKEEIRPLLQDFVMETGASPDQLNTLLDTLTENPTFAQRILIHNYNWDRSFKVWQTVAYKDDGL